MITIWTRKICEAQVSCRKRERGSRKRNSLKKDERCRKILCVMDLSDVFFILNHSSYSSTYSSHTCSHESLSPEINSTRYGRVNLFFSYYVYSIAYSKTLHYTHIILFLVIAKFFQRNFRINILSYASTTYIQQHPSRLRREDTFRRVKIQIM